MLILSSGKCGWIRLIMGFFKSISIQVFCFERDLNFIFLFTGWQIRMFYCNINAMKVYILIVLCYLSVAVQNL